MRLELIYAIAITVAVARSDAPHSTAVASASTLLRITAIGYAIHDHWCGRKAAPDPAVPYRRQTTADKLRQLIEFRVGKIWRPGLKALGLSERVHTTSRLIGRDMRLRKTR